MKIRSRRWIVRGSAIVVVLLMIVVHRPVFVAMGHWLDAGQPPKKSDYVMVLPGGPDTRTFAAVALVRRGWAEKVLLPENKLSPGVMDGTEMISHVLLIRILTELGVDPEKIILLPGRSDSTFHDIQALGTFMEAHPQATITVVTDDYHTRRTRWVLSRILGHRADRVRLISSPDDRWDPDRWWQYRHGWSIFTGEYLKLTYYFLFWSYGGVVVAIAEVLLFIAILGCHFLWPGFSPCAPSIIQGERGTRSNHG